MYDICSVQAKPTMRLVRVIYLKILTLILMEIIKMFVTKLGIIILSWKQQITLQLTSQNPDVQYDYAFVTLILQY